MTQMSIAIGMETFAYSNVPRNAGMDGRNLPIRTPAIMQMITQRVRYLANIPRSAELFFVIASLFQ